MEEEGKSWICWVIYFFGGIVDELIFLLVVLGRGLRYWMEIFMYLKKEVLLGYVRGV